MVKWTKFRLFSGDFVQVDKIQAEFFNILFFTEKLIASLQYAGKLMP